MADFKKFGGYNNKNRGGGNFGGKPAFKKFGNDRNDRGFDRPKAMYKTTCAECGNTCEVPFRPNGEKPVFCNDCFADKRDGQSKDFDSRPPRRDFNSERTFKPPVASPRPDSRIDELKKQVDALHVKVDKMLELINSTATEPIAEKKEIIKKVAKKKPVAKKK